MPHPGRIANDELELQLLTRELTLRCCLQHAAHTVVCHYHSESYINTDKQQMCGEHGTDSAGSYYLQVTRFFHLCTFHLPPSEGRNHARDVLLTTGANQANTILCPLAGR